MGVDKEELEATRKLREKTADKMFEELGFELYENKRRIEYFKDNREIIFYKTKETFISSCGIGCIDINMQELKAINKKCEELGWL